MTRKITASCLCGDAQLLCGTPAGTGSYCHCEDCRRSTGSAFSVAVPFEADGFRVLKGRIGSFAKLSDGGNELTRNFCLGCGAPLFGTSPAHPGRVYVKAGVINDQSIVRPTYQSWCRSKVGWSEISGDLPSHPQGKP